MPARHNEVIPLITVYPGGFIPIICAGKASHLPLPSMRVAVQYRMGGKYEIIVSRDRLSWGSMHVGDDSSEEDDEGARTGERRTCLRKHDGRVTATRRVLGVFPFLFLLQTDPLNTLRALPSGSRVAAIVWDAAVMCSTPDDFDDAMPCDASTEEHADAPEKETDAQLTFLSECCALAGMDDVSGSITCASVRDALLSGGVFTSDDLHWLQVVTQLPGGIGSTADDEARDVFILAATLALPTPFPLVNMLELAFFVNHASGIDRCLALLECAMRGEQSTLVTSWWHAAARVEVAT